MKHKKKEQTALVLGGGGSRGAYELGVWQALRELQLPIDMVFGTSIGAINGAMIVQDAYEETISLWKELDTSTVFELQPGTDLSHALELISKKGGTLSGLKKILTQHMNEETIRASHMNYGLVTVEIPSIKAVYLTKADIPEGKLMDYICASASCFPAIQAYEIDGKKYVDGGYLDNVPIDMAVAHGATKIISVDLHSLGLERKVANEPGIEQIEIYSNWDLGNFMIFDKKNSSKLIRLGYLETMKTFGQYDGSYYTFVKGDFDAQTLANADQAAKVFDLSTEIIYDRNVLNALLVKNLKEYNAPFKGVLKGPLAETLVEVIEKLKASTKPILIALAIVDELKEEKTSLSAKGLNPAIALLLKEELAAAEYIKGEGLL